MNRGVLINTELMNQQLKLLKFLEHLCDESFFQGVGRCWPCLLTQAQEPRTKIFVG